MEILGFWQELLSFLQMDLESSKILTISCLLIHERGISFHLFSSFRNFRWCVILLSAQVLCFCFKFIWKYSTLYAHKWNCFLIFTFAWFTGAAYFWAPCKRSKFALYHSVLNTMAVRCTRVTAYSHCLLSLIAMEFSTALPCHSLCLPPWGACDLRPVWGSLE